MSSDPISGVNPQTEPVVTESLSRYEKLEINEYVRSGIFKISGTTIILGILANAGILWASYQFLANTMAESVKESVSKLVRLEIDDRQGDFDRRFEILSSSFSDANAQITGVISKSGEFGGRLSAIEQQYRDLNEAVQRRLNSAEAEISQKLNNALDNIGEIEIKISQTDSQLTNEISNYGARLKQLRDKVNQTDSEYEGRLKQLSSDMDDLSGRSLNMRGKLDALESSKIQEIASYVEVINNNPDAINIFDKLRQIESAVVEIEILKTQFKDASSDLAGLSAMQSHLGGVIESVERSFEEINAWKSSQELNIRDLGLRRVEYGTAADWEQCPYERCGEASGSAVRLFIKFDEAKLGANPLIMTSVSGDDALYRITGSSTAYNKLDNSYEVILLFDDGRRKISSDRVRELHWKLNYVLIHND